MVSLKSVQTLSGVSGQILNTSILVVGNYTMEKWRHLEVSDNDNDFSRKILFRTKRRCKRLDLRCYSGSKITLSQAHGKRDHKEPKKADETESISR